MSNSGKRKFKRHTEEKDAAINAMIAGDPGMFEATDFAKANRGRPKLANPKKSTTLRLDADVLELLKATGPGWQTRVSDLLRVAFGLEIAEERWTDLALRDLINVSKDTSHETKLEITYEGRLIDLVAPERNQSNVHWYVGPEFDDVGFAQGFLLPMEREAEPTEFGAGKGDSELVEALKQVTDAGYLVKVAKGTVFGDAFESVRMDLVKARNTLAKYGYLAVEEPPHGPRFGMLARRIMSAGVGATVQKKPAPGSIAARNLQDRARKLSDRKPEQD